MKRRSSRACKETADTLALGAANELQASRAEFHLEHCPECQQTQKMLEGLRQAVNSADDSLDDVTRARVQTRLVEAMEQAGARSRARVPLWRSRGGRLAALAAAVLAVATASFFWWAAGRPTPGAGGGKGPPAVLAANQVLQPRAIVAGSSPWPNSGLQFGQMVDRIELPAGVALRAGLAKRAELTLYGPLKLAVKQVSGERVELRLSRGILVAEFDGSQGGTLSIRSPRAVTEVLGTLFSVEAHDGQSRVSVSRGRVRVLCVGESVMVGAGQTWSSALSKLGATPASVSALFARHDRPPELTGAAVAPGQEDPRQALAPTGEAPGAVRGAPSPAANNPRAAAPRPARRPPAAVDSPPASPVAETGPVAAGAVAKKPAPAAEKNNQEGKKTGPGEASRLYGKAEEALRRRDEEQARQILSEFLRTYPKAPLADSARYELALLLLKGGKRTRAQAVLSQIGQSRADSRFRGPAHYLGCRIKQESGKTDRAMACYRAFRDTFPTSPHDQRALQALIGLSLSRKDCRGALSFIADYLALYPAGPFAGEARRLRQECRP